jgi:APA family basic amino acid/polyamine antiporter
VLFFAYVGFDAVACSAEEAANPKVDVPFGMLASLATVTVLYTLVATALTLMVQLPAHRHRRAALRRRSRSTAPTGLRSLSPSARSPRSSPPSSPRTSRSRASFSPWRATASCQRASPPSSARAKSRSSPCSSSCIFSSVVGALVELESLSEMVSIGTLMALSFVCASVLILRYDAGNGSRKPFFLTMAIVAVAGVAAACIRFDQVIAGGVIYGIAALLVIPFFFMPKSPMPLAFKTPLVPVVPAIGLGLNLFLMSSLSDDTWWRLFGWTIIGLLVYFIYSIRFSKLTYGEPAENNLQDNEVREGLEEALTKMDVVALEDEHVGLETEAEAPVTQPKSATAAAAAAVAAVNGDDDGADDKERLEASLARTKLKNKRKDGNTDDADESD